MKKLILFIVLILGFINENKAQFAASSEIYFYIPVSGNNWPNAIRFTSDGKLYYASIYPDQERINKEIEKAKRQCKSGYSDHGIEFVKYYFPEFSTSKYYTYKLNKNHIDHFSFSLDKEELIHWMQLPDEPITAKFYYKRVSESDIKAMFKPNLDFLE